MNEEWTGIQSDYNKAKEALWCPKGRDHWHRAEELGHYYMWKAYHHACAAEPKDYLLFARIALKMELKSRLLRLNIF